MSGPNLSEYFRNDAPSMFDEIVPSSTASTNTTAVISSQGKSHTKLLS